MSSRRKKAEPKGDKYPEGSAAARAEREALNRRWEARQRELDKQQRGAQLLGSALQVATQTDAEHLQEWEVEMLAKSRTRADSRQAPPIDVDEEPTKDLWRVRQLLYNIFGNEEMRERSNDADREVGAGYEHEEEYSR